MPGLLGVEGWPLSAPVINFGVADVTGRLELRTNDAAIGDNAGGGSVTLKVNTHRECRSLGTWNSTSVLPIPNAHAPAVTYNDRIYVVGGGATARATQHCLLRSLAGGWIS